MTATAGPGISLMSEFIGLGYYAEVPTAVSYTHLDVYKRQVQKGVSRTGCAPR